MAFAYFVGYFWSGAQMAAIANLETAFAQRDSLDDTKSRAALLGGFEDRLRRRR